MNPENAIASVIIGIFTSYMIYSMLDINFSSTSLNGVSVDLILAIVLGFIVFIIIYASTPREE